MRTKGFILIGVLVSMCSSAWANEGPQGNYRGWHCKTKLYHEDIDYLLDIYPQTNDTMSVVVSPTTQAGGVPILVSGVAFQAGWNTRDSCLFNSEFDVCANLTDYDRCASNPTAHERVRLQFDCGPLDEGGYNITTHTDGGVPVSRTHAMSCKSF